MSAEVAAALAAGRAVVALESTIISHGMPFPQNLETARQVQEVVRAHGAVPATIAVLRGVPHVGLTPAQLEALARAGQAVRKVSRRDLPLVMALQLDGATTVSATMLLAARAGIAVFVTGGAWPACCCTLPPAVQVSHQQCKGSQPAGLVGGRGTCTSPIS
jgi:pseudouridine-5'-phosphate glycosidase